MTEKATPPQPLELLEPSNELLNQRADLVRLEDIRRPETQAIIDRMFEIAYGEQGDAERKTLVGLAAPQIGINKRIILVGVNAVGLGEQPELQAFINPVIFKQSAETEPGREGCYSTDRVCGIVDRSVSVTVRALDRTGKALQQTYTGFPARVFQHEVDHLNGVRIPDRITDDNNLHWVELDRYGEYRHNWQNWDTLCPRENWEAIKEGR